MVLGGGGGIRTHTPLKKFRISIKQLEQYFSHDNMPLDNYVIWPGSLALMNREPITLRNLLMRARLQHRYLIYTR
jgi:hypothetical protein